MITKILDKAKNSSKVIIGMALAAGAAVMEFLNYIMPILKGLLTSIG